MGRALDTVWTERGVRGQHEGGRSAGAYWNLGDIEGNWVKFR
jgi:hypothetical protein